MHHGDVSPDIAAGLLALKKRIDAAKIPSSKLDESINVAVWNIREFGKKHRTDAAIHFIAEILGQFDLVAMVELRNDLTDLGRTLPILGPSWDVVYSDWQPDPGGNDERVAFLFDSRAVTFNGLATDVDAPRVKTGTEFLATSSFWRAPYMCSFRSGNFDFIVVATHARWGKSIAGRKAELQMLADWIDTRFRDQFVEDHDLLVMGDFNVPKIGGAAVRRVDQPRAHGARRAHGLEIRRPGHRRDRTSTRTPATTRFFTCRRRPSGSPISAAPSISSAATPASRSCFPTRPTRVCSSAFSCRTTFRSGCR